MCFVLGVTGFLAHRNSEIIREFSMYVKVVNSAGILFLNWEILKRLVAGVNDCLEIETAKMAGVTVTLLIFNRFLTGKLFSFFVGILYKSNYCRC